MTVRFITDKMYADTGFQAQYDAIGSEEDLNICKLVGSQLSLTFVRSNSAKYLNQKLSVWVITFVLD